MPIDLTEKQISLIVTALHIAIEAYKTHVKTFEKINPRLADQFLKQLNESLMLIEKLEA